MLSPVPQFTRALRALAAILTKAEAYAAVGKIDPAVLPGARLYPDMLNLTGQVQLACDFAARAAARLAGDEIRNFADTETTLAELQARIATALAYLAGFGPERFAGAEDRQITLKQSSGDLVLSGAEYLAHYSQPQFFFHLTTAYCLLRHNGLAIGKRDYMGD